MREAFATSSLPTTSIPRPRSYYSCSRLEGSSIVKPPVEQPGELAAHSSNGAGDWSRRRTDNHLVVGVERAPRAAAWAIPQEKNRASCAGDRHLRTPPVFRKLQETASRKNEIFLLYRRKR